MPPRCFRPRCLSASRSQERANSIDRTPTARSGQIVVARLGEEVTVKRLKRRGREITLVAENPAFPPIVVDPKATPFAIEGIAVGLIRASRSF
jgi:repressor LexA